MHCSKKKRKMVMMKKKKMIAAGVNEIVVFEVSEDLILEILPHLPPISLVRFKSVSKTWYSLISNPDFLRRNTANQFDKRWQLRINDHPSSILLKRYQLAGYSKIMIRPTLTTTPSDNDQPFYYYHQKVSALLLQKLIDYRPEHDEKGKFWVIDSCNGLLLYISIPKYIRIPPAREYNLYVCNPITHDYIKLPTFEQEEREQGFKICRYSSPNIVFDPSVSLTYKVVIWLSCSFTADHETINSSSYRLYVYCSATRSWRLIQLKNTLKFRFNHWRGVLCNGVIYWRSVSIFFDSNINIYLRYDVEKDVISTLNFPLMPPGYSNRALLYFGECGGRLRLIETYYKDKDVQLDRIHAFYRSIFDVMELDNNDDLWTVKYRVNFGDDQVGYCTELIRKYRPTASFFGVHILDIYKTKTKKAAGEHEIHQGDQEEEEEEEELLLNIWNNCIIPFNLSSNTFGKELRHGEKNLVGGRFMDFTEVLRMQNPSNPGLSAQETS